MGQFAKAMAYQFKSTKIN